MYNVYLLTPYQDDPTQSHISLCELKITTSKRFMFFGKEHLNISLNLVNSIEDYKPMNKKDAELTAQIAYLSTRAQNTEVRIEEVE